MFVTFLTAFLCTGSVWAYSDPPAGAITVGSSGTYSTLSEALDDTSSDVYFVYAGTYQEQVFIDRSDVKIYGETTTDDSYTGNTVTISYGLGATEAGSNDASGTVRVHGENVALYNLNIENTFGKYVLVMCSVVQILRPSELKEQAIALSVQSTDFGGYGLSIVGYQDTLLANVGYEFIANSYIEGNTDFIFGQRASLWITGSVIKTLGDGWITASGRSSDDDFWYVIDNCEITGAGGAYLGRPWRDYARVVFQNSVLGSNVPSEGWSIWNVGDERTDEVTFAEYGNTGDGADTSGRASFSEVLDSAVDISTVLGSTSWTDSSFL
ncbi:pectin lyase fold/virulence factor [Desarmillaria tabescens]|uniref:pectinesterase n=1 Tax=Armillaria tabescens TaxID=1929756 RepID=A0AA39JWP8_ARMTA|nr:pectin lyase fold/virulence factor [Desarmillaria tabescens]KAK0450325.1 pectin lyase fold/virulence factor [Desarmillaria tabescens]